MFSLRIKPVGRLFWKLFFALWLSQLTAVIGVGTVFWLHRHSEEKKTPSVAVERSVVPEIAAAAAVLRSGGVAALNQFEVEAKRESLPAVYAVDERGRDILGRPLAPGVWENVQRLGREGNFSQPVRTVQMEDGHRYVLFISALDRRFDAKSLSFSGRRSPPAAPLLPVMPVIMGLLTSLLFSAGLAWYLSKPIRHLGAAFKAMASGQLDTRVEPAIGRRRDELADLGREFDHMAQRIGTLMVAQRRLLHDVSHELRSPLARLHAAVGLARQQPDKTDASLDRIEREAGRLDELVGEVLTLSRLEAGVAGIAAEEVDLGELLESILEDARFEAAAKNVIVEYAGLTEIRIQGHAELILRAIENILRNAVKYTPPGETVRVETESTSDGRVHLRILDQGPGVPEAQLASIFEPFFRGGADTQTGFGLGLAIARRAMEAHGGSIIARNRPEGGLRIEMVLPVEQALE